MVVTDARLIDSPDKQINYLGYGIFALKAFVQHFAVQCGFCTPGMIIAAKDLLDENPSPTEDEVREALAGNLCRCTGYVKIVEAVLAAKNSIM